MHTEQLSSHPRMDQPCLSLDHLGCSSAPSTRAAPVPRPAAPALSLLFVLLLFRSLALALLAASSSRSRSLSVFTTEDLSRERWLRLLLLLVLLLFLSLALALLALSSSSSRSVSVFTTEDLSLLLLLLLLILFRSLALALLASSSSFSLSLSVFTSEDLSRDGLLCRPLLSVLLLFRSLALALLASSSSNSFSHSRRRLSLALSRLLSSRPRDFDRSPASHTSDSFSSAPPAATHSPNPSLYTQQTSWLVLPAFLSYLVYHACVPWNGSGSNSVASASPSAATGFATARVGPSGPGSDCGVHADDRHARGSSSEGWG